MTAGFLHHPRRYAAQPVVPPAQRDRQEVDRPVRRPVRQQVPPRPHEQLLRPGDLLVRVDEAVRERVPPAADAQHRGLDRRPVDGSLAPDRVARPVPGVVQEGRLGLQHPLPPASPSRRRGVGQRRQELLQQQRGAAVGQRVQVAARAVGVDAVPGRVEPVRDRDDRPERGRPAARRAQRDVCRVRQAPHPDRAVAPGLCGRPLDRGDAVVGVTGVELRSPDSVGVPGAEQVDDEAGVPAGGEPAGRLVVAAAGDEVLPVRQHGHQRRDRPVDPRPVDVRRERQTRHAGRDADVALDIDAELDLGRVRAHGVSRNGRSRLPQAGSAPRQARAGRRDGSRARPDRRHGDRRGDRRPEQLGGTVGSRSDTTG